MGTPNREPQEYSRSVIEYEDPGRYVPITFLLYSWGSLFEVPSEVPLVWSIARPKELHFLSAPRPHVILPLKTNAIMQNQKFKIKWEMQWKRYERCYSS